MKRMKLIAALLIGVCLSACGNTSDTTNNITTTSELIARCCPFENFSDDDVLLMSPAYAPQLLKPTQEMTETLSDELMLSSWEQIEFDGQMADGENYSVFVYNDGQPYKLTFYSNATADFEQNGVVSRYKVDENVFGAVSDAVNIENAGDYLVDYDMEDISVEGVWENVKE